MNSHLCCSAFTLIILKCLVSLLHGHFSQINMHLMCPSGYKHFVETNISDLCCQCSEYPKDKDSNCCACYAVSLDDIMGVKQRLKVIYVNNDEPILVSFLNDQAVDINTKKIIHIVEHTFDEKLKYFPYNICDYPDIISINFSYCNIQNIPNITCLTKLEKLFLMHNKLTYITNFDFEGLISLREVDISHNNIKVIEPFAFQDGISRIIKLNATWNKIEKMEIATFLIQRKFCIMDFSSNPINEFTNKIQYQLRSTKLFYGGIIQARNTNITKFFDFEQMGIDVFDLGLLFRFGFDFLGTKWTCDCKMVKYMKFCEPLIPHIDLPYFDLFCYNPPSMRNTSLVEVVKNRNYDQFVCNISFYQGCPFGCHCFRQPSRNRVIVNCSGTYAHTAMPFAMPSETNLHINMRGNGLTHLSYRDYLKNTVVLDLSDNKIKTLDPNAFNDMDIIKMLNLTKNPELKSLPQSLQLLDSCIVLLDSTLQDCSCSTLWIHIWAERRKLNCKSYLLPPLFCNTTKGIVDAALVTSDYLCCLDHDLSQKMQLVFITCSLCSVAIVILIIATCFHWEFFLIWKNIWKQKIRRKDEIKWDVTILHNYENDDVVSWVHKYVIPLLKSFRYGIFIPTIDLDYGSVRLEEYCQQLPHLKTAVVILSEDFFEINEDTITPWHMLEWNLIWQAYKAHKIDQICVINFDFMNSKHIYDSRLKAFSRLGKCLDFSNKDCNFQKKFLNELGPPRLSYFMESEVSEQLTDELPFI